MDQLEMGASLLVWVEPNPAHKIGWAALCYYLYTLVFTTVQLLHSNEAGLQRVFFGLSALFQCYFVVLCIVPVNAGSDRDY
ncbi:hypothetical protein BCR34DRAFT_557883 [Clohesyomyces aquaticus]|uniref:Uncharacterized protein n=1 Tax=Clohesyomyces aquaticus TaxID=1231657 RepID=A0A1Y2A0B0_9PLEO|nr:hypothetical protein BCR34DRAFT_557883 [Clohesyomyces aquaticus]